MAATTTEEEEDRISSLSDDVLNHILSFLPTKTSVETSTLSRRWRHLWKDLSFLNFSDHSNKYIQQLKEEQFKTFALFVNGVLTRLRNPRGIRKMTLECALSVNDKFRYYSVDMWIRAAIGPCLEELMLSTFGCGYAFELPQTLFTSTNLASLSLCGGFHVYIQSSTTVSLPSLKMLVIDVAYMEVSSLNTLLCGCPNIEILNFCCFAQSIDKVCVPPSLKRLRIDIDNDAGTYLEISAPALEYLNISTITFGEVCSMYNLHNVVEACLDVFPQSFGSVIPLHNLLGALSGTKHLVLSRSTTKWLLGKPHDLLFQEFRYLVRLKLKLPWFNSNSLLSLLQKCPMLQVLIIKNDKKWSPDLGWAPQSSVPNCLVSHLTFIKFKGLRGFEELSFVEHVLQKGLVLKTMIIADISLELHMKYNILKRLSNVPRASEMCQLTFD